MQGFDGAETPAARCEGRGTVGAANDDRLTQEKGAEK